MLLLACMCFHSRVLSSNPDIHTPFVPCSAHTEQQPQQQLGLSKEHGLWTLSLFLLLTDSVCVVLRVACVMCS